MISKWELMMVRLSVCAGIGISGVVVASGYGFWYRGGAWWGLVMAYFGKVMIFAGGITVAALRLRLIGYDQRTGGGDDLA